MKTTTTCTDVTTTIVTHRDIWQHLGDVAFLIAVCLVLVMIAREILRNRRRAS